MDDAGTGREGIDPEARIQERRAQKKGQRNRPMASQYRALAGDPRSVVRFC